MDRTQLIDMFRSVRQLSEDLCRPLETEDYVIQTIEDISPPKWHLGHTTWFFEQVVLQQYQPGYTPINEIYYYIFNSYYESFGDRVLRNLRGTLSRPTVQEVMKYRRVVTERIITLITTIREKQFPEIVNLIILGINHEQQHQELFITDIKHIFAENPLRPVYNDGPVTTNTIQLPETVYLAFDGGTFEIGAVGNGFAYDNEHPRHTVYVEGFKLSNRLVTCGEFLEFIDDNGYRDHRLWLSDGWSRVQEEGWVHPLYWEQTDDGWKIMTLSGMQPLHPDEPVCHVSYYEAAAYARWSDKRLPTEAEWEVAAQIAVNSPGHLLEDKVYHPIPKDYKPADNGKTLHSLPGDVWEWTGSAYLAYPGYKQTKDALGEYNGKFMSNQMVLRGGSCATPRDHIRTSYRNFFQCEKRWQFTGLRLAADL